MGRACARPCSAQARRLEMRESRGPLSAPRPPTAIAGGSAPARMPTPPRPRAAYRPIARLDRARCAAIRAFPTDCDYPESRSTEVTMLTIYHWEPNANSGKPILAAYEKGVAFESRYVDLLGFDQHS